MISRPAIQWVLLAAICLGALTIRVAPGWEVVYGDDGVNLQGGDAYYHLRSIQTLTANFPWRSGFDPYALYPKGLNVPTGPLFDYVVAGLALVLGAGDPSPELIEHVAAWVPAVIGALAVLPAFLLGRALLNGWAGLIAAAWMAVCSGHSVVYAKLGFADHHVFETLFYGLALYGLALAIERDDDSHSAKLRYALLAGVAIGCALLNRPAAAFLGALFGAHAAVQAGTDLYAGRPLRPAVWPVMVALVCGWVFLLPAGGGAWGRLPHLAMVSGLAAAATGWALAQLVRARRWPFWTWPAGLGAAAIVGFLFIWTIVPGAIHMVREGFTEAILGGESRLVGEVRSLLRIGGLWSLRPLLVELGPAGLLALPAFAAMGLDGLRTRDRALLLTAMTGAATYGAALLQARMSIYVALNLAVAVGWCVWKLLETGSLWTRLARGAAAFVLLFLPVAVSGVSLVKREMGMSDGWRSAASWLRTNTPDPLGDPDAYLRYYPRKVRGQTFSYPPEAYGVMTWWDKGYWVMTRGRRAPIANGTQSGAREAAAFYTATEPAEALALTDELGARYITVDHTVPVVQLATADFTGSQFRAMTGWANRPLETYMRVVDVPLDGGDVMQAFIFYPEYFQTMAARLYLHDGESYEPRNATTVFSLKPGKYDVKMISSSRTFETYEQALRYTEARPDQDLVVGTADPYTSCVPLEAVEGLRLVHNSNPGTVVGDDGKLHAVKIFERVPRPANGRPAAENE